MRLSPSGRRLVFVAGKGLRPSQPMVTVVLKDGTSKPLAPGHDPRWLNERTVVFCPQTDGVVQIAYEDTGWRVEPTAMPAGNSLTAAAGRFAAHRTDPRRIFTSWRGVISQATDPVLSDDGEWLAYLLPDSPHEPLSTLLVERADGEGEPRILWTGAPVKPRFGGRSLVWETGGGQIAGIADVGNPNDRTVVFALAGWRAFEPVPVLVPSRGELFVLFLADDGQRSRINLAEWASVAAGAPRGYELGTSTESGYEHDARPVWPEHVVAFWLDPKGVLDGNGRVLADAPRDVLHPPPAATPTPIGTPVTAPKALAYWFDFGRYGTFSPKRNATVIGSGMFADGSGNLPADVDAQLAAAVNAAGRAFLGAGDIGIPGVDWSKVLGVFIHEPSSPDDTQRGVKLARDAQGDLPRRPVIAVLTPDKIGDSAYTGTADALAFEIYFDAPATDWDAQVRTAHDVIDVAIVSVAPTPVYLVVQAYDRSDPAWQARPDALEALQAAANEWLTSPRVLGLWWFAYGRPGGVVTYPKLEAWHAAQVAVTPAPPLPSAPPIPDPLKKPEPPMIEVSEAKARAGYPVPSNWIEGALMRYRNEVLLERDKIAPDSMSLGALRVFLQHYGATMSGLLVERGVPGGDGWGELSVRAFAAASAEYRRITADPQ